MEYILKFSAVISLFYIFYKILLQKETFFNSIRTYFLIGISLAIGMPFIVIPEYIVVQDQVLNISSQIETSPATLSAAFNFDMLTTLMVVYILGVLFFLGRFIFQLSSLISFITKLPKKRECGFVFIQTAEVSTPFSFFNFIIYPDKGFNETEIKQIINHEKIHTNHYHSLDILISQLVIVFNWFNPIVWLYHKEIQKNLEFIADEGAINMETPKISYQYLLLKTVSPNYKMTLTSNFYNSTMKNRITMLHKNKSTNLMYAKFSFIIPVLIAFVINFNTELVAQEKHSRLAAEQSDVETVLIKKDFQQSDLENTKKTLEGRGIDLNFSNLKYNEKDELIGIHVKVSNAKGNKSNLQLSGDAPIQPISISFNNDKNTLILGYRNVNNTDLQIVDKDTDKIHRKVVTDKDGNKSYVVSYGDRVIELKSDGDDSYHISSTDSSGNKTLVTKNVIVNNRVDQTTNVDIHTGDSATIKYIELDKNDNDSEVESIVIREVSSEDDQNDVKVTVLNEGESDNHNRHTIHIGGKKPLIIVDGKEMENKNINDIDPNDIESIHVLKGNSAIEKYGDKGKDGVILIKSKN